MKFYGGLLVLLLGSLTMYVGSIAQGPDFEVKFVREVYSDVDPDTLTIAMESTANWPRWFHSLKQAQALDPATGEPSGRGTVAVGTPVRLFIEPAKREWKRFVVDARVTELVPQKSIQLKVLHDSTGKLDDMFEQLEWKVELDPVAPQAREKNRKMIVRGICTAKTRNWRARVFGKLTPRILMYQVYYVNLIAFSKIRLPYWKLAAKESAGVARSATR
jgi:hypothetical protein